MFDKIANKSFEMRNNIAYFVPEKELEYNLEWAKGLIDGNWVEVNWKRHLSIDIENERIKSIVAKKIISFGGLVMEIGTGPGGGFMPYVLDEDINSKIIISDLSPTVVKEWKRFFDKEIKPKNIYFTALNHCDIPFKDETINVVSSNGGFGNTEGDKYKAIKEIYRIILPGGMFVNGDVWVNPEYAKTMPPKALEIIKEKHPTIFCDFEQECYDVGFKKIETIEGKNWSNKEDESDLATLCRELNTYIVFSTYVRYCYK